VRRRAGASERIARKADGDRGEMAEVGEGVRARRRYGEVADEQGHVPEPYASREEVAGQSRDGEEAVAGSEVEVEGDGRRENAGAQADPESGRDDERRADVPRREGEERPPCAEPSLDRRQDREEEREPPCELTPPARPERAADENEHRRMRELVKVRAEREEQPVRALGAGPGDEERRRRQDEEVAGRERHRLDGPQLPRQRPAYPVHPQRLADAGKTRLCRGEEPGVNSPRSD
jgi:hypothetical protein